jgi:hypothetical protein
MSSSNWYVISDTLTGKPFVVIKKTHEESQNLIGSSKIGKL